MANVFQNALNYAKQQTLQRVGVQNTEPVKPVQSSNIQQTVQNAMGYAKRQALNTVQPTTSAAPSYTPKTIDPVVKQTTRGTLAAIQQMNQTNPTRARYAMDMLKQLQSDPSSRYYNPYATATNPAVDSLASRGIDTSTLTGDWFRANTSWQANLLYNGTTGTPSKPGKKATDNQLLAYDLYQYQKSEELTEKAEQEWKALQEELSYWANRRDRNYSDDEILQRINWGNYKTLSAMDESRSSGSLLELNRAVGYSQDAMYGVLWAARNNGGTGDPDSDMANSCLRTGNQWQENKAVSVKLDLGDRKNYSPYSVGMTMDDEGLYFGRDSFDQKWIDENWSRYMGSGDETAIKAFNNVVEAENYTQKLESELDAMKKDVDYLLQYYDNPEDIIAAIQDTSDYDDLFDLDKTMTPGKNYGKLKGTTRAVDYRWKDIEAMIREKCATKSTEALDDMLETSQATTEDAELPPFYAPPEAEWIDDSGSKAAITPVGSAYNPVTPAPVTPVPQQTAVPTATPGMPTPTVTPAPVGTPAGVSTPGPVAVPTPAPANVQTAGQTDTLGEFGAGNINLHNRPVYVQEDGSISTVNSMSFYDEQEKKEILIPTIVNGQQVSDDEAVEHYYETGEYLGKFDTPEEANEYAEKLHEQQETLYAQKGATVVPVATPGPTSASVTKIVTPVHNETQKAINAQAMANLNKMAPTIMGQGTDAEKVALQTGKNAWFDLDVKLLREGKMPGLAWLKNQVVRSTADGYMETSEKIYEYESHQKNRQDMADALSDITAQWEALNKRQEATDAIANASTEEYLNIARLANDPGEDSGWGVARAILEQGENYVPESPVMPDDPEWALAYLYNEVTGTSPYGMDTDSEANLARAKQWWEAISSGEYQGIDTLTNEEQQEMNDLRLRMDTLNERIEQEDEYLKSEEKAYRKAQSKKDGLARRYTLAVMLDNATGGKSDTSLLNHLDYIFNAGTEELRPEYLTDNVIDLQVQAGNLPAEMAGSYARASVAVNLQAARELESSLAYLDRAGVKIPERTRRIVLSKIDTMRKDAKEAAYVMLDDQKDFESVAATGMEKARNGEYGRIARTLATGSYGFEFGDLLNAFGATNADRFARQREMMDEFANLMTPKEKSRYFYLLEKEGEKAANDYFNMLTDPDNGVLINRRSQELQEGWQEMASGSVAGAIFGTALSFLTNMQAGPSALIYEVGSKLQGKGINPKSPWFDWGNATSAFRTGTKEQLTKAFGEGSFGDSLSNLLYDGFTSSVDSLINSQMTDAAFGAVASFFSDTKVSRVMSGLRGLMEHTPAGRFAVKAGGDLAHAIPMGLSAATTAYKDVIERYGPEYEEQAVRMAMATLFAETASEAITVGNIHDAFAKGQKEAATSLKSILIDFLKQGGEEFLGEGANEWVEQNADRIIMGQLSEYEQIAQSYIDAGYPETLAYEMADREAWRGILRSAATGFVSAGFSTSVSYVAGRVSSRGLTEETATEPAVTEETVTEPAVTEETVTEPAVTEETVDAEENPTPDQQRVEEVAAEQRAQAEAAANERIQELAKDVAVLGNAGEADATGAAVAITATLNGIEDLPGGKAAAQNIVSVMAGGDAETASSIVAETLFASERSSEETKQAIVQAALTNGAGHRALEAIMRNVQNGRRINADHVDSLFFGINQDRTTDPASFDTAIQNAIKESQIANRTMEILQNGEAGKTVAAAQEGVNQAKENLGRAQETKEKADAEVETASSTLSVAVNEQLQDAGNPALNAPVEQASNQLDAALNNQDEQQKAVEGAQQNLDKARQKQQEAGAEAMTEARTQATAEVEQTMLQEAQVAYDTAVAGLQPTAPFGQSVTVYTQDGGTPVKVTGVYDIVDNGRDFLTTVYTTEDGRLVTSDVVDDSGLDKSTQQVVDSFIDHEMSPTAKPAVYLPTGFMAKVDGEPVQIIGLAGVENNEGADGHVYTDPVLMSIDGNLYGVYDQGIEIDDSDVDSYMDVFEATLDENPGMLPVIPRLRIEGRATNDSEYSGGNDAETETGLPVQGTVGEGDNQGQLAGTPGRDGGLGDNGDAEYRSSGEQGMPGRGEESTSEPDGSDARRGNERFRIIPDKTRRAIRKVLKERGATNLNLQHEEDYGRFSSALDEAKARNQHGLFVDAQSVEELEEKGAITILSANGLAGVAIGTEGSEKGNIFGVFKNPRSRAKRASASLLIEAIAQGGNKLDCYDGFLTDTYSRLGFVPVARVAWSDAYHTDDGWNYERDGRPEVIVFAHNGDSAETVAQHYGLTEENGGYHKYTDAEMAALPLYTGDDGYGEALAYRDQLIAEGRVPTRPGENNSRQAMKTKPKPQTPTQKQAETVKAKYSPATIAKNLAKAIGVGDYIGTRKFDMDSATQAYYDRHSKSVVARNKNAGNYIVTMHELGHAIAHKFGLTATNELVTNFLNDPNPESGIDVSAYDPAALPGEAMAEFMWHYMQGEQSARRFAGDDFYDTFEETIRGTKEGKAIAEARDQMQLWLNADANEKIGTTIKNRSDKIQVPLKQRIREFFASMVDSTSAAAAFDEATGADNVLDSVRAQAAWANTAGKQATSILMGAGLTDANGNVIGPSLAERFSSVGFKGSQENLDLLNRYWLAKHSLARDEQGKPVFDEHITKEARQAFIDDIEQNHPEIAKAEQELVGFWHDFMQEFMVNTGRLTQEAFDEMNRMYPDYAPTFRVKSTDGTAQRTGKGKIFQIQRASGSTENIYNPLDSLFGMINTIVGQNALNRVALTFDRMYQTHEGLGSFAREVIHEPGQKTVEMSNKQQQVKDLVGNMIDADTLDVLLGIVGNGGFTQNSVASHDTLKVVRPDGTIAEYQFEDMELFKLLAGINNKTSNAALDAVGFVTRAMSALTTGSNPIFAARNFMRDFQNSVNYGSWASNYGTGVIKWLRAAYEVWRGESQDVKDYEALGGGGWTRIDPSRVASRNELYSGIFEGYETSNIGKTAKWAGKKVWNAITLARLNEVVEQASRFAEYKYGKHDLNTQEGKVEAFLAAQDATVDFNRAGNGKLVPAMKKLVPFFNASVQGVYRAGRMLTKAERGRAPARFTKTVVNTALLSALCSGILLKFMDDDDKKEFEMLSDDLKSKHFYLPNFAPDILGEAPLIRIPLAQDPLTYAIHGAVTNAMWSGQTEDGLMIDLATVANTIIDNLNPLGSGTVFAPILAVNANKSWFGSRIVPSHLERNKYAPDQYTEETPGIFRTFGRWLNMSPMKIQYLAEQYTGFLGQLAIPALSMNSRGELGGLPAAINAARKRFVSDPLTSNDVVGSFYDGADILNSVIEETNQNKPLNVLRRGLTQEEAGQAYEEAKSLTSTSGAVGMAKARINELYNEIDEINERQGLSDREKYQLTSEKRREMIEVAVEANEKLGEYTEKYVTGSNMATRMISEGSASYKPTAEEKLPQTFKSDEDRTYMQRASEVYSATGKESALPHPSQKLTITDRLGNQEDYTIADEDWDRYTEIYKVAYESYMVRKGARWETLTDKQKQQLLTSAHSAGNKAMREQYARENGIQMKK